jgi:ribosomal protein S18 acetylase RimI-like enzyme
MPNLPDPDRPHQLAGLTIEPFTTADQDAARALILAGMADHWGEVDASLNPDLDDIGATYADAVFLVAKIEGRAVATGAVLTRSPDEAEIVRMAVAADLRRRGIGQQMLTRLCAQARARGMRRVVLETTARWEEVVAFYRANGFRVTHQEDGTYGTDTWFALDLT